MAMGRGGNDKGKLTETLGDLLHLDVDAVRAYDEAIEKVEEQDIRSQLSKFRDDHQRHINSLTDLIRSMGGEPPTPRPDFKGVLAEGMTKLRSSMGTDQAMKAMRQNEMLTNRGYKDALEKHEWPMEARQLLERNYGDEQVHLRWVEEYLSVGAGHKGGTTGGTYRTDY